MHSPFWSRILPFLKAPMETLTGEVTLNALDSTSIVLKQRIISSDSFLLLKAFYRRDSVCSKARNWLWFFFSQKLHKNVQVYFKPFKNDMCEFKSRLLIDALILIIAVQKLALLAFLSKYFLVIKGSNLLFSQSGWVSITIRKLQCSQHFLLFIRMSTKRSKSNLKGLHCSYEPNMQNECLTCIIILK